MAEVFDEAVTEVSMLVSIMRFGWKNFGQGGGMNMRTETTGNAFQMRRLGERDVDAILALCE